MDWYEHDGVDRDQLSGRHFARRGPEQAAVGAAASIVDSCTSRDEIGPLPELTSALLNDVISPYLGSEGGSQVPQVG